MDYQGYRVDVIRISSSVVDVTTRPLRSTGETTLSMASQHWKIGNTKDVVKALGETLQRLPADSISNVVVFIAVTINIRRFIATCEVYVGVTTNVKAPCTDQPISIMEARVSVIGSDFSNVISDIPDAVIVSPSAMASYSTHAHSDGEAVDQVTR